MPVSELALRGCSLFARAPDDLVKQVSEDMAIVHLKRREVLHVQGRAFRGLGVVLQGRIQAVDQTLDGREVALQSVDVGQAFGQVDLLAPQAAHMVWMASAPSAVGVLDASKALALLELAPMGLLAAREMAAQVSEFLSWQKILTVTPISARVCAWVCWVAAGRDQIEIPKHSELAWRLNTTRESITRTFQKLQADGLMQREDPLWRILRPEALVQLAQGDKDE